MTILAHYIPLGIEVEVTAILNAGGRKRVVIYAVHGEPFTVFTHGGPMDTYRAVVSPDLLCDVQQVAVPQHSEKYSRLRSEKYPILVRLNNPS